MSTYAIGDIHGCWTTLQRLLEAIEFDPDSDTLWLTGDLVNGGPESLKVLRWARSLGERVHLVLGNHDLHMLAVASGAHQMRPDDDFHDVLEAPDADELLDWLRRQHLFYRRGDTAMVHAGLLPSWDLETAGSLAAEVEEVLRGPNVDAFFDEMYGNEPRRWRPGLEGTARLRLIVNATTRMRVLDPEGRLDFDYKETFEGVPDDRTPWFAHPERRWSNDVRLLFGHWSAIGYHRAGRVHGLDSGCVWGDTLTALRLENDEVIQVPSELPSQFD